MHDCWQKKLREAGSARSWLQNTLSYLETKCKACSVTQCSAFLRANA